MRAVALAAAVTLLAIAPAHAQSSSLPLLSTCQSRSDSTDGVSYRFCSAPVASFDGTSLDVDLTLPSGTTPGGGYPLLVMMHGWGADKTYWEGNDFCTTTSADACNYNNVWFASRGYAVLTYTARGFYASQGYTHLSDMRWEVHDTQYLSGLLVDAGVARQGVGVTGLSYGGGQSWLLAVLADKVMNPDGSLARWRSPAGTPLHVAAAVPKYTWSDLIDALQPNGRSSDGVLSPNGDHTTPFGIEKKSYVDYFYNSGQAAGRYAPPGQDPTADMTTWYAEISAGETPAQSSYAPGIVDQIAHYRSAYYQDSLIATDVAGKDETPVFAPQGWTDSLFTESQAASMIEKLRAADPAWQAYMYASDIGHPLADNSKFSEWRVINQQATAFLDLHVRRSGGANPSAVIQEQVTTCTPAAGAVYTRLPSGRVSYQSSVAGHITASAPTDAEDGAASDPIAYAAQHGSNGGCVKVSSLPPDAGFATSWSFPICASYTLLGEPSLQLSAAVTGTDAEINARMWDVAPDGGATLVTRAAYRWTGAAGPISITYALQGNGWFFAAGHQLRIQVTQNDAPYLRLDNYPSAITYSSMTLTLPVVSAPGC
jgi:ABC-2 type transport system ATP-binding protein